MPWDIDIWRELNNGRTLTLYDIGRSGLAVRTGLDRILMANRWSLTMAGSSVRYRKRVRMFDRITITSRALGYDDRFFYLQQNMTVRGTVTSSALMRAALTGASGLVPPARLIEVMGMSEWNPALPEWVGNWIEAEATRPWPPVE